MGKEKTKQFNKRVKISTIEGIERVSKDQDNGNVSLTTNKALKKYVEENDIQPTEEAKK